ncbi:hypothetical protein B0T18DRAFT_407940 [Schizothecium vesticola]|uniref:Uncharacterized protein n=1 Tax=Schizothecium vesticola TaxID=314040 RepID=A0AA40F2N2_9PEZI|nr:hypothetical protein B0T18DRAFT_407940 [Schizothecium vesticola]
MHLAAGPIWSKPETRRRSHGTPGSPGSQTLCDSLQKAETCIDHRAIGSRAKNLPPVPATTLTGEIPSPFQTATRYTLGAVGEYSAGPQGCGFPLPFCSTFARGRRGFSILPTSHFQRNHDNPTFPIQQKPWRCHQKRSCCLEAARIGILHIYGTGQVGAREAAMYRQQSLGRVGQIKEFVVQGETRVPPPHREKQTAEFFFQGRIYFGLPDLRRGLGNGTLRASASQTLGAVPAC